MSDFQNTAKQEDQEEKLKRIQRRDENDLKKVLSLPEGRRLCRRIFASTQMFTSCFTGNSTTFYNEGKRDIGLSLTAWIMDVNPEAFHQMMKEHYSEIKKEKEEGEKNARTNN